MYRLLVTGARAWDDVWTIEHFLDGVLEYHDDLVVVHGDCPIGADAIAKNWSYHNYVPQELYPALWDGYGKAAGHIRNKQMVDTNPDYAVAFIKGEARGTLNCLSHIEKAGIPHATFRAEQY